MKESTTQLLKMLTVTNDLDGYLKNNQLEFFQEDFVQMVEYFIHRSKKSKYQMLIDAEIDTNYGYQILNGRRKPNRDKVIQLSFALHLSLKELQLLLLSLNERQLYVRSRRDAIVMFAIEQEITLLELEALLIEKNEEILIKS